MFPSKTGATVTLPLDLPAVTVQQMSLTAEGDYLITVESTARRTRCRVCGQEISRSHGGSDWLQVRHLPLLGHRVYLRLRPKRYVCWSCPGHPTTTQVLSRYLPHSPHTVAYDRRLLLQLIGSTVADVCQKERLGYDAVDGAVARQLQNHVYAPRLHAAYTLREELTAIFELPLTKAQARRRLQQWMQKCASTNWTVLTPS